MSLITRFNYVYGIDVYVPTYYANNDAGDSVGLRNALADATQEAFSTSAKAG